MEQTFNKDGETHWYSDPSTNGGLLHFSPESNLANFTCLVGVALSDQTMEGVGNLGLLKGGWKVVYRNNRQLFAHLACQSAVDSQACGRANFQG